MSEENKKETIEETQIMDFYSMPHLRVSKTIKDMYDIETALWIADISSRWNYFRKKNKLDKNNFFFITKDEIKESTGVKFNKQTKITQKLKEDKIIEVEKRGLPARNWYKINLKKLIQLTGDFINKQLDEKQVPSQLSVINNELSVIDQSIISNLHNNNKDNNINFNNNKNSFSKEKEMILKNHSFNSSDNPPHKDTSKNKPLQRSKSKESTLSERDKIRLKIKQQKEADLSKQENKILQTKNKSKNSKEIIYNKNNSEAEQLLDYWNELEIIKHKKGKVIEQSIIAIDKYLKDYTKDQIKQSMKQYKEMLSSNNYSRIRHDKSPYKVSLSEFFEFNDFTLKRIQKSGGDRTILKGVKSWFIECLNDKDYLKDKFSVIAKDKYPKITAEIKKAWNKYLYEWDGRYEEMKENGQYTSLEENIYRKISRRLVEFFEVNKNELKADDALELTQWFESYVTEIENSEYQLGFLAGDIFWGSQFINYLKDCGDMSERTYTQKEMMALSDKEKKQMNQDEDTDYSYLYEGMQNDVTIHDFVY